MDHVQIFFANNIWRASGVPVRPFKTIIIYINEVAQLPLTAVSKLAMYADDILLYRPVRSTADLICLQEDTTSLGLWANSVNLPFNPRKCKAMILSRRKHVATPSPLLLNGQPVYFVDSIRYLGLTISTDLSWSKHIKNITSKARQLVVIMSLLVVVVNGNSV